MPAYVVGESALLESEQEGAARRCGFHHCPHCVGRERGSSCRPPTTCPESADGPAISSSVATSKKYSLSGSTERRALWPTWARLSGLTSAAIIERWPTSITSSLAPASSSSLT